MKSNKIFIPMVLLFSLFVLSGCVSREIPVGGHSIQHGDAAGGWADMTNVKKEDDVDISDLEENLTENETTITEETMQHRIPRIPFPIEEYHKLSTIGKGTIKGKIYLKDMYGQPIVGVGTRLYLNPVTSYSNQWYQESYLGGARMEKADSRLFNYLRFTAADNEGNFAFYGVPSGSYYLIGTVKCGSECGYDSPKNIRIATRVNVMGSQTVEKNLVKSIE